MVNQAKTLDRAFAALADPTRRAIVDRLARGEASATAIAAPFDMSLPAVLKHLGVLEEAGLARCEKIGRVRWCRLDPRALDRTIGWIERRRKMWEKRLGKLARLLEEER